MVVASPLVHVFAQEYHPSVGGGALPFSRLYAGGPGSWLEWSCCGVGAGGIVLGVGCGSWRGCNGYDVVSALV